MRLAIDFGIRRCGSGLSPALQVLRRGSWHFCAVVDHLYRTAITQPVSAFQYNAITGFKPFFNNRHITVSGPYFDAADLDLVVTVHGIDKRSIGAVLNGRRRCQNHIFQRVSQQVYVDELVGEQRLIAVLKQRLEL